MKHCFKFLTLFLILFVTLYTQNVFSQTSTTTPENPFTPQNVVDNLINPNTGLPNGIEEQITITQIPKIPQPGEQVNIRITGYTTDLNKAIISWTLNNKLISSSRGATSFTFTAPSSGDSSTLVITIQKEKGGTISKTIVVNPADVDLMYEAQTYTHPFFKGKKEFTSESVIKYIALPNFVTSNGSKIADSNLVYTWKVNNSVQQSASGYGRNTFLVQGSLIERSSIITVDVSAVNSTLKASQSISIRSTTPDVVLYENNPLLGIVYEKAIKGTFLLNRPQVDFEAVPYFFSSEYINSSDIAYKWSINGIGITSKSPNENYLVLRNEKNEDGLANIAVSTEHITNILQTTRSTLKLDFNKVDNISNEEFTF